MMARISLQALPESLNRVAWPFYALYENLFGVEQMASYAQAQVFGAGFAQQIEQMQATQSGGGLGSVQQSF